ncbi:MAG: hypothetical protein MHM6MM_004966 [Cercozoa sp. M6MM]
MIQSAVRRSLCTRRGFGAGEVFSSSESQRVQIKFDDWLNYTNDKLSQYKIPILFTFGVEKRAKELDEKLIRSAEESQKKLRESTNEFKTEIRPLFLATALTSNERLQAVKPSKVPNRSLDQEEVEYNRQAKQPSE